MNFADYFFGLSSSLIIIMINRFFTDLRRYTTKNGLLDITISATFTFKIMH